ncbi:EI24 domain-containing protein [Rhodoferax sp.]|uniref:EI24 domain-containing protein n=1 Tax=Rhodoferax sp. TaxID=50421 RepID=UPI00374D4306
MKLLLNSFWRAVAYCMHPRVIALSFLPLILLVALSLGLGYFYWEPALDMVRSMLDASEWMGRMWTWLETAGVGQLKVALAPLLVIFAVTPFIVVLSLLVVALMMTPALVSLVAERRFPMLEKKKGGTLIGGLFWSLGSILLALVAMLVSVPLWLVPPLILVLPPLIWGWLTYRVMSYDALSLHASKDERREIFRRHRLSLLGIGILTGYLGAAPSLVWASGALFAAAFVILVPLAIWIYTLVFAFSSLWFAHYLLAALEALRAEQLISPTPPGSTASPVVVLEPVTVQDPHDLGNPPVLPAP